MIPALGQVRTPDGASFSVLHNFGKGATGRIPSSLTLVSGRYYGTTQQGGSTGNGTVFSMTQAGKVRTIYNFGNKPDGSRPIGSLLFVGGQLYGVTNSGGTEGQGKIYSITLTGTVRVLHNFKKKADAAIPAAGLVEVNGTLYGTATSGGLGFGAVYSIKPDGSSYRVLYRFQGGPDGSRPYGTLTYADGTFYGTTLQGGKYGAASYGYGTVYSLTPNGTEHVLHSFRNNTTDGGLPASGLLNVNGLFYGTTDSGGKYFVAGSCNAGTAYSITSSGQETILHNFGAKGDGVWPAVLIYAGGKFYGTTWDGGTSAACISASGGTIFSMQPNGTERLLHVFLDNATPTWPPIYVNGALYGPTLFGGTGLYGYIYKLSL
jgi:uncharacterized repeat protein (TIGR03803 family)